MIKENAPAFMEKLDKYEDNDNVGTLILAAHTDSRSYAAFDLLTQKNIHIKRIVVFDYECNRPSVGSAQVKDYYRLSGIPNVTYVQCDSNEADCHYICNLSFPADERIMVDITSVSIPDVFRLFFVLKEILGVSQCEVIYSEPKYYEYLNGYYFEYDKEIVQRDYRILPEFFTSAVSRDVLLVCFIGFERLVSKYIHERKEHSDVLIINGFPAFFPKIKDISMEHNSELISAIGMDRIRYAQANDPFSAFNALRSILDENKNDLLDICVLGSKPMALGACMFALEHQDQTKVSFPFPKQSQKHASIDVADIWWYKISL